MTELGRALIASLGHADLVELAERLAPLLPSPAPERSDGWLTSRQAAQHLAVSLDSIQDATSRRVIPFQQSGPGARCYYRRAELDRAREEGLI